MGAGIITCIFCLLFYGIIYFKYSIPTQGRNIISGNFFFLFELPVIKWSPYVAQYILAIFYERHSPT